MWSSILQSAGDARGRGPSRALLYLFRFGEDSTRLVSKDLFKGKDDRDLGSTLGGLSFSTWEPPTDDLTVSIDIWELNNEATYDNLKEIFDIEGRIMYVLAVDSCERVCTSAIEKFLLHVDKHKKANPRLQQVSVTIVAVCDGENKSESEDMILEKIEKISCRVNSSLLFVGKCAPQLGPLKSLVVHTLFPELDYMNESDRSRFRRLGPDTTADGWGDDSAPRLGSSEASAGKHSSNTNNRDSLMENVDLVSFVENLAQQVVDEDPIVDVVSPNNSYEAFRQEQSEWIGGLKEFVSNMTKTSDDVAGSAGAAGTILGGTSDGSHPAGTGSADSPPPDKTDDATSFFQDLLTKR